ncbi:hypothetical protein SAMN05216332_110112 [Nitrosospira briensis]|nr:hypothetical protein SAMN05216332_110112 [Nitrosospira briensis]
MQKIRSVVHYDVLQGRSSMSDFKWRHFRGEIILSCVRWYCKYGITYRDLEEMMLERGLDVDHTTLYRWVQHYAPEMEKRLRWFWKPMMGYSWRVDETYFEIRFLRRPQYVNIVRNQSSFQESLHPRNIGQSPLRQPHSLF